MPAKIPTESSSCKAMGTSVFCDAQNIQGVEFSLHHPADEEMTKIITAEGENINKLEKADILELTVRHLHRITKPHDPTEEVQRFQAGFTQCASEACGFLLSLPGLDTRVGKRLVEHLGKRISQSLEANPALLLSNGESFSPAGGYERDDYATLPRDARVPSSLGSATQDSLRSGVADNASSQSSAMMLPQSNPGMSLNLPNSSLHPYTCDEGGQGSRPYPKLMCPQPTRPLMLSIPPERAGFGVPMSFPSSLSPETSMSRSPGVSMSGTSNAGSMPLLSPATSSSIVGEMDTRQDRMAISPGALSMDGSSSCHSEDMWRPCPINYMKNEITNDRQLVQCMISDGSCPPNGCPPWRCQQDSAVIHGYCCGCARPTDNVPFVTCRPDLRCPLSSEPLCTDYNFMMDCCCTGP
ncbi:protein deadpan-like [Diaphorina citri]|uniref:Protein deadpan-like n=1 Tax=Diaphorina citri TaxID=121845 RepID=A0A3Q0INU4_DIACI|nr:protein deadpan-like [Diaphorina citri]